MTILLFFAFVSGLVTIFAPCIWPLLPIILSSSATGGHKKPLGITLGIIFSFGVLTLSISYIVRIIPFDPTILRYFAVFVIGFLGVILIVPRLSAKLEGLVSRFSGKIGTAGQAQKSGFWSGFITGSALGIVWTPCAGPILATIATLAATQSVDLNVVLVTVAYMTGVGIPLFIFATLGKYIFSKSRLLSKYTGAVQQIFGVIMVLSAVLIATNYDKVLQAKLLDAFPSYANFIYDLEGNNDVKKQLDQLRKKESGSFLPTGNVFNASLPNLGEAPDFLNGTKWLNTDAPVSLSELKGKVVLVDFWTYTCINCIRTLPFITSWYEKYKDEGFVVIGVHTPEFEFEKQTKNVESAIKQYKIHYPVVQDNEFAIWGAYNNRYWPAKYLIDVNGLVRYTHFGEGEYDTTEKNIQTLLKEAGQDAQKPLSDMPDMTPKTSLSPETYLGSSRMEYYFPERHLNKGSKTFVLNEKIPQNTFSLGGGWTIDGEYAVTEKNAVLAYHFFADQVFLVVRPAKAGSSAVKVYLDGKAVTEKNAGKDVANGVLKIDSDRLYHLIDLRGNPGKHLLKLEFQNSGIEVFAFTFG